MTDGPAVVVDGLVKRYAGRAVVDGLSFAVEAGELVALLGPNGAGKTTTVETIEGYRQPDAGTVRVLGRSPSTGGRELRARVGLMLQDVGVDPRARARETLRLYARFHADPEPADELLERVGLAHVAATPFRRLSGGERRRLGLALALVGRPEVLVLDEPTAGMDPEARAVTRAIVTEARTGGAAILLTSHDLTDVERLADRVVVIDAGRMVATGSPADLAATGRSVIRVRLDRPLDEPATAILERRLAGAGLHAIAEAERGRYRVDAGDAEIGPDAVALVAAAAAEAGRLIVELRTGGGSLEEAYLALVAGSRNDGGDREPRP